MLSLDLLNTCPVRSLTSLSALATPAALPRCWLSSVGDLPGGRSPALLERRTSSALCRAAETSLYSSQSGQTLWHDAAETAAVSPTEEPTPPLREAVDASSSQGEAPSFQIVRSPGDGSCLFASLAAGDHFLSTGQPLAGVELRRAAFECRRRICGELLARQAEFEPFVDGSWHAYMAAMMLEGTWGGEVELAAAPAVLRRPVIVYQAASAGLWGSALQKVSEYGREAWPGTPPVCVLFSGLHYDLLVQQQ